MPAVMPCSPVRSLRASGKCLWAGRVCLDRPALGEYVKGMGGEKRASPRASIRGEEQGDRDAPRARGHGHEAEGESAARAAGGTARDERGARVRGAWWARWPWWAPLWAWRPWLYRSASWGVHLAVLGPVLDAVCGPAGRRRP